MNEKRKNYPMSIFCDYFWTYFSQSNKSNGGFYHVKGLVDWSLDEPMFPDTPITITVLPTYPHIPFQPTFVHFLGYSSPFHCPYNLCPLILSSFVTPHIHLNSHISATSSFFSCAFFTAHVSAFYIQSIVSIYTVLHLHHLMLRCKIFYINSH